jgi:SAM-dependent methyltransferase
MTQNHQVGMRPSVIRRKEYNTSLIRYSYFVTKHLQRFLFYAVNRYIRDGDAVGDIGCGEQPLRLQVEALGGVYTGIDVTQNTGNSVGIIASCTDVPLPNYYFNVILCTEVLEHVSDSYKAFRELARLLKPGGFLIVTMPFAYPLHEEPYDFVRFTPYQFREYAENNDLQVLELTTSGNEIEVIATVWDVMWRQMLKDNSIVTMAWIALMRLGMNLLASLGSKLFGHIQPRKCYLTTFAVLQRRQ